MDSERSFSTQEAARLLGINVSTAKRWADGGHLRCAKTSGGHRRFRLDDIVEFAEKQGLKTAALRPFTFRGDQGSDDRFLERLLLDRDWGPIQDIVLREALGGNEKEVGRLFTAALVSGWHPSELCDHVIAPAMAQVGHQWAQNRLTVADEHLATHTIGRSLTKLPRDWNRALEVPLTALCGVFAPDLHELACSCVALVLSYEGWDVRVLGAGTPSDAFVSAVERIRPDLVCVSATVIYDTVAFRTDCERLSLASLDLGNKYVIGGAALAETSIVCPHGVARIVRDMAGLADYVKSEFPRPSNGRHTELHDREGESQPLS